MSRWKKGRVMAAKIAIVGGNGRVAKLVAEEAQKRGFEVWAIVRGKSASPAAHTLQKDAPALAREDLEGFDVVVDAVGAWSPDTLTAIPDAAEHLAEILSGTGIRLVVVGGAGSLYVDPAHTTTLAETPDFPDAFKGVASAHQQALDSLRGATDVAWTYISPAADFQAEGKRTGTYTLAGEELVLSSKEESTISYADYALALVDEIESGAHLKQRISVVSR